MQVTCVQSLQSHFFPQAEQDRVTTFYLLTVTQGRGITLHIRSCRCLCHLDVLRVVWKRAQGCGERPKAWKGPPASGFYFVPYQLYNSGKSVDLSVRFPKIEDERGRRSWCYGQVWGKVVGVGVGAGVKSAVKSCGVLVAEREVSLEKQSRSCPVRTGTGVVRPSRTRGLL